MLLEADIIKMMTEALLVTVKVAAPMLLMSMVVGLFISIVQTTTSIQEQTLTFVPKLLAVFIAVVIFSTYIIHTIVDYTRNVFLVIRQF
ncbi:MAG: flagellar biosynthesis protein FliQ [Spirochaetia bacterium]|nr:flagellar biosynthesis protein FliQ [Spirochaetia bacterium]